MLVAAWHSLLFCVSRYGVQSRSRESSLVSSLPLSLAMAMLLYTGEQKQQHGPVILYSSVAFNLWYDNQSSQFSLIILVRPLAGKMPLLLQQLLLLICCCCHQRRPAAKPHSKRLQVWLHKTKEPAAHLTAEGKPATQALNAALLAGMSSSLSFSRTAVLQGKVMLGQSGSCWLLLRQATADWACSPILDLLLGSGCRLRAAGVHLDVNVRKGRGHACTHDTLL